MNKEEKEAPLEDSCVCWNCLARERHAAQSEEQHATDASCWQAAQKGARNNAQIVTEKTLLLGCMHLLNGSARSYIHDMQLFKTECFFEINMV